MRESFVQFKIQYNRMEQNDGSKSFNIIY